MIQERQRHAFSAPVHVLPGDKLICTATDKKTKKTHVFEENIGRTMTIDTVVTFDAKNEFGLEDGIGAVFGKAS